MVGQCGSISHLRIIAARLRPRNISNSEPCRASRLSSARCPMTSRPLGSGGSQSMRINAQNQRPFLRDDMEQSFNAFGLEPRENGFMDRGNRARMAARKGDKVLV